MGPQPHDSVACGVGASQGLIICALALSSQSCGDADFPALIRAQGYFPLGAQSGGLNSYAKHRAACVADGETPVLSRFQCSLNVANQLQRASCQATSSDGSSMSSANGLEPSIAKRNLGMAGNARGRSLVPILLMQVQPIEAADITQTFEVLERHSLALQFKHTFSTEGLDHAINVHFADSQGL